MKRVVLIFWTIIVVSTFLSCKSRIIDNKLKVYGICLGDSLTNDFKLIDQYGENLGRAICIKDPRLKAFTINSHVYNIHISRLTEQEMNEIKSKIENSIGKKHDHYIGTTHEGIKIIGEEYFLSDLQTKNEYSIGVNTGKDSIYSFSINNETIVDSLSRLFIKDYNSDEIEFSIIEE